MNKKTILTVVIIVAVICACVSGGMLIKNALEQNGSETVGQMPETGSSTMADVSAEPEIASGAEPMTEEQSEPEKTEPDGAKSENAESEGTEQAAQTHPYAEYYKQNKDMAAWLTIPGMDIDYPVMQTPGDEEYYLRRGFDKKKDRNGCLILDTDSSLSPLGTNLMIHGHNMKSGKMFGTLTEYANEEFYKEHKTITLYTEECEKTYEVMAVFYSQVYRKSDHVFKFYQFFQADTEEEFQDFYDNVKKMSEYDTGVTAEFGDHFLTLVTCSYHVDNGRFVVVAKETASGQAYAPIE